MNPWAEFLIELVLYTCFGMGGMMGIFMIIVASTALWQSLFDPGGSRSDEVVKPGHRPAVKPPRRPAGSQRQ